MVIGSSRFTLPLTCLILFLYFATRPAFKDSGYGFKPLRWTSYQTKLRIDLLDTIAPPENRLSYRRLVLTAEKQADSHARSLDILPEGSIRTTPPDSPLSEPVVAPVPVAFTAADPGIMFGIATTVERLIASIETILYWWTPNSTLVVVVPPSDLKNISLAHNALAAAGIRATVHVGQGMANLSRELPEHLSERLAEWQVLWVEVASHMAFMAVDDVDNVAWYCIIDDDTFFPNIAAVWTMLTRYPGPKEHVWYIGSKNERRPIAQTYPWANGGSGVFLSATLMRALRPVLSVDAPCAPANAYQWPGDAFLGACITQILGGIPLREEKALHEMGVKGNPDGIYESPESTSVTNDDGFGSNASDNFRLLSVHHWKRYWMPRNVLGMSSVRRKTGEEGVFHRYMIWENKDDSNAPEGFWIMTNGYSLVYHDLGPYKDSIDAYVKNITTTTEVTWTTANTAQTWEDMGHVEDTFGAVRPPDDPTSNQRYSFRAAVEKLTDEPWRGYFVHEDQGGYINVVEVVWV